MQDAAFPRQAPKQLCARHRLHQPTIAIGIALFRMKSTRRSKRSSRSVSKRRINPLITSMESRVLLHMHAAQQHDVRPGQVGILQPLHIGIDQALGPRSRQQGGHRHQAQRRLSGTPTLKGQRIPKTSLRIRKIWDRPVRRSWDPPRGARSSIGGRARLRRRNASRLQCGPPARQFQRG